MTDYKEYIYAIYQEKSFSKAAKKLYVSQPWLSATVKKVEQQLQIPLFDRSTNPISLTDAGRYYIEQIERIMAIEEEMQRHFNEMRSVNNVELHIGSSMFFCTYVLPKLLTDFCALYPQVTLTFTEGTTSGLTEKLRVGQLDFLLEAECPLVATYRPFPGRQSRLSWRFRPTMRSTSGWSPTDTLLRGCSDGTSWSTGVRQSHCTISRTSLSFCSSRTTTSTTVA